MQYNDHIDDQMLGAFVDGELDTAGRGQVLDAMENDQIIRERVYKLRRAKDLMKLGFDNMRAPGETPSKTNHPAYLPR